MACATDLRGLPPTLIVYGAPNGYSDENMEYANPFRHAAVPTDLNIYAGASQYFDT